MSMFDFIGDWQRQVDAAKPIIRQGIKRADWYACRMIDLLTDIRGPRVKTFQKVNTYPDLTGGEYIEVPSGQVWKLAAVAVAGDVGEIVIRQGGMLRYAESLGVAETVSINPEIIAEGGSHLHVVTTKTAEVALIFVVEQPEPEGYTRLAGDPRTMGDMGQWSKVDIDRHATDEATKLGKTGEAVEVPTDLEGAKPAQGEEDETTGLAIESEQVPHTRIPPYPYHIG